MLLFRTLLLFMSQLKQLSVLLAPFGQLSGDGQLRESFNERRDRKGKDFPLWFLTREMVIELDLAGPGYEAVIADDPTVVNWLQLRFGGEILTAELSIDHLNENANDLPPTAPHANLSLEKYQIVIEIFVRLAFKTRNNIISNE